MCRDQEMPQSLVANQYPGGGRVSESPLLPDKLQRGACPEACLSDTAPQGTACSVRRDTKERVPSLGPCPSNSAVQVGPPVSPAHGQQAGGTQFHCLRDFQPPSSRTRHLWCTAVCSEHSLLRAPAQHCIQGHEKSCLLLQVQHFDKSKSDHFLTTINGDGREGGRGEKEGRPLLLETIQNSCFIGSNRNIQGLGLNDTCGRPRLTQTHTYTHFKPAETGAIH